MTKIKPIALVDMDDVIADFTAQAFWLCDNHGIKLDIDHRSKLTNRWISDHVPDEKQRNYLRKLIDTTRFFEDLDVIEGAQDGVKALAKECEVWFCSKPLTNNESCVGDKDAWIKRHFPKLKDRLILAGDKSLIIGDILLDDAPKTKWFPRAVWQPVIYSQPFNGHGTDWGEFAHFTWQDPIEYLIELAYAAQQGEMI